MNKRMSVGIMRFREIKRIVGRFFVLVLLFVFMFGCQAEESNKHRLFDFNAISNNVLIEDYLPKNIDVLYSLNTSKKQDRESLDMLFKHWDDDFGQYVSKHAENYFNQFFSTFGLDLKSFRPFMDKGLRFVLAIDKSNNPLEADNTFLFLQFNNYKEQKMFLNLLKEVFKVDSELNGYNIYKVEHASIYMINYSGFILMANTVENLMSTLEMTNVPNANVRLTYKYHYLGFLDKIKGNPIYYYYDNGLGSYLSLEEKTWDFVKILETDNLGSEGKILSDELSNLPTDIILYANFQEGELFDDFLSFGGTNNFNVKKLLIYFDEEFNLRFFYEFENKDKDVYLSDRFVVRELLGFVRSIEVDQILNDTLNIKDKKHIIDRELIVNEFADMQVASNMKNIEEIYKKALYIEDIDFNYFSFDALNVYLNKHGEEHKYEKTLKTFDYFVSFARIGRGEIVYRWVAQLVE